LPCQNDIYGAKWTEPFGTSRLEGSISGGSADDFAQQALELAAGETVSAAPNRRRSLRQSLDSDEDPPRNVGAVPNRPQNIGASSNRPNNVGIVPKRPDDWNPYNVAATPNNPDNIAATPNNPDNIAATPNNPDNIAATPNNPDNIAATPNNPDNIAATPNSPWCSLLHRWGFSTSGCPKVKRDEQALESIVAPNSVTISGHTFDLDAMPTELKSEIFGAFFNQTRFEDLSSSLLDFEFEVEDE
jgi:hypothetical protein